MLEFIMILVAVAVIVLVLVVAFQPEDFRITRSTQIAASADVIFPHVNNLHNWHAWSPWAKLDPHSVTTFTGPEFGIGAIMAWSGNNKVGVGKMTITECHADQSIQFQLDFEKPFQGTNIATFTFQPDNDQTTVTWTMTGKNNFVGKAMNLVINCDKMVGGQFEKGLASLKAVIEVSE